MGTCLQGFELQDLTNDALREAAAGALSLLYMHTRGWVGGASSSYGWMDRVAASVAGGARAAVPVKPPPHTWFSPFRCMHPSIHVCTRQGTTRGAW